MRHLAIIGGSPRLLELAGHFQRSGLTVTLLPDREEVGRGSHDQPSGKSAGEPTNESSRPCLALVEVSESSQLGDSAAEARRLGLSWLALCAEPVDGGPSLGELTTAAYQAGALAVLPAEASAELIEEAVERALASVIPIGGPTGDERPSRRRFRAGDAIRLRPDEMLTVVEGVVAQVVWHEDGTEGLVGLWGAGQLLCGHPDDDSCLSLRAHTEVWVEIGKLATGDATFTSLLERVQQLESWSSMQSRQTLEQRLLGVLVLLARQFGEACTEGTMIRVRVTHAQLAAAIGASRATVTRLLGPLRRRGLVTTVPSSEGERFCLPSWHGVLGGCGVGDGADRATPSRLATPSEKSG